MNRKLILAAGFLMVFIVTILILLRFMPGLRQPADYLVIGTLATLVCILLGFVVFLFGRPKRSDLFYKRKKIIPSSKSSGR